MDQALLERIVQSPKLPTLPAVAIRILELTQDADVSIRELADTIQNDQAIAAKVLRTVNSSFYGLRRPCTTINQALVMLGLSTVKTLALSFSLISTLRRHGDERFDHVAYWKRGLYSAAAARLIARKAAIPNSDEAFLGGLLQDIGIMAMYQTLGKPYLEILNAAPDHRSLAQLEMAELDTQHADVGALLAQRWKLPIELIMPIKYHEQPTAAPEEHAPVVRAVALANIACDVLVAENPGTALRRFHACAARWFDLSAEACDDLLVDITSAARELSSLFVLNIGDVASADDILYRAGQQLAIVNEQTEQLCAEEAPINSLVSDSHEFDPLTGALTRRALIIQTMELLESPLQDLSTIAVAALEIEGFASIEQMLTQDYADALLVETACALEQHLAPSGARFSRWERGLFVILMPGADESGARLAMERICLSLAEQASGLCKGYACSPPAWNAGVSAMSLGPTRTTHQGLNLLAQALRALEHAHVRAGAAASLFPQRLAA
jgi:two-component system, cell cycle response regulator